MADASAQAAAGGKWYVVAVEPRREATVSRRSREIGVSTFYPVGRRVRDVRGRRETTQAAVIPGYVFVHVDRQETFSRYRRDIDDDGVVPGCHGWLGNLNAGPERVPDETVGDLMSRSERGDFDQVEQQGRYWAPRWLRAGKKARVTAGPFENFIGEIWRMTAERRVSIWLNVLGGLRLVELELEQIARVR